MADDYKEAPRKWSLEEIDELLQDSGMLPRDDIPDEQEVTAALRKAEAVDPRPTHNDEISHKIKRNKVEHSELSQSTRVFGALESDKYRERFLNRPMQNLEKTAEHTPVSEKDISYERSGFVKREADFKNTRDLDPVPMLVSDDMLSANGEAAENVDDAKTKTIALRSLAVTDGNAHDTELPDEDDAQLSFEGFVTEEEIEKVDEADVERELNERRREKAEKFVLSKEVVGNNEEDKAVKFGIDEYRTENNKFKVTYYLKKSTRTALFDMIAGFVIFAGLIAMSVATKSVTGGGETLIGVSIALLALLCVAGRGELIDGIKAFKGLRFNRNSGAVISLIGAFIQAIALIFADTPFKDGLCLYGAAASFPLILNMISSYIEAKRIYTNFRYITSGKTYSIGKVDRKDTAFEIGRGLLLDEPVVLASQKTLFPRRFLELSKKYYPSDEINKRIIPIGVGVSVLVGALTYLVAKNMFSAVTGFTASLCMTVPYFSYLTDSVSIGKVSKKLLSRGAMIAGWEAYKECSGANAVAIGAEDVFDENGGNIYGIKTFYSMKVDEAILDTAALLVASGGPLGNLFKRVIMGRTELLPPVDTLAYEDKLGLSAWLQNRRVLVGSTDLLRNHNVEVPEKAFIEKYLHDGRYPLFLAIEGKLAAMFIVSYDINEENAKRLKSIERNSVSLLVKTDDANITDEMIASSLSLPQSGVKVLSAVSGDIYKAYRGEVRTAADASLMHDGKSKSFLDAISGALSLGSKRHVSAIIQIGAVGIGIAFVAAFSFVSGLSALSCMQLVITQTFFSLVGVVAARLK